MPKLLFFISEDWFFVSHFLPMARVARQAGFEVAVVTRIRGAKERILQEGFRLIPFQLARGSNNPISLLRALLQGYRIIREDKPDIVHCIALRMAVLGGISAKLAGSKAIILAPTGLGHVWTSDRLSARLMRAIIRIVVGKYLRGTHTHYLFENIEDPQEFEIKGTDSDVTIVAGAGVDPMDFPFTPESGSPPVKIAVVSRMLRSKGIEEAVKAVGIARSRGVPVELNLYGAPDPENPSSIPEATLHEWSSEPGIVWHGETKNVSAVWREQHIALFLTSYREGVPRTLIEAAASGRAIITTDVAGCREVVRDGQEGLVVRPGDIDAAARAIEKLARDPQLRLQLGQGANRRFHERFTEEAICRQVRMLYATLVARP